MRRLAALLCLLFFIAACGDGDGGDSDGDRDAAATTAPTAPPASAAGSSLALTSTAFVDGRSIPREFTCDGDDKPPPLTWSGVPDGSAELVLLMEDPDAPSGTFVHWVVYALPPADVTIGAERLPVGAVEGESSRGRIGYVGPCPPPGDDPHRYVFTLIAVPERLDLPAGSNADDVREAIADDTLGEAVLTGTYGR